MKSEKFEFSTIQSQLSLHGKLMGFRLDAKPSPNARILDRFLISFHCCSLLSFVASFFIYGLWEHLQGTSDIFADMVSYCISQIGVVGMYSNLHIYWRQTELRELLQWCSQLYWPTTDRKVLSLWLKVYVDVHRVSLKLAKFFFLAIFIDDGMLFLGAILSKVFLKEGLLMLSMYKMDGFVQDMPWYWILLGYQVVVLVGFLLQFTFNLAIFAVITQHINGQFRYISLLLENLDDENQGKFLDHIINLHADVLAKLQQFARVFSFPLLLSELAPLACFVLVGLTIFVKQSDYHQAASTTLLLLSAAIYAHFGESIIQNSQAISFAAYSYTWYQLSIENQKKLKFIMVMSQKPVGVTSGGFHNVSYHQFQQV